LALPDGKSLGQCLGCCHPSLGYMFFLVGIQTNVPKRRRRRMPETRIPVTKYTPQSYRSAVMFRCVYLGPDKWLRERAFDSTVGQQLSGYRSMEAEHTGPPPV
jgi:hypothetical protein